MFETRVSCIHFHVIVNTLLVSASIFLSTLYRVLRVGRTIRTKILARRFNSFADLHGLLPPPFSSARAIYKNVAVIFMRFKESVEGVFGRNGI